jgi:ectoine hydroxylase
VFGEQLYMH